MKSYEYTCVHYKIELGQLSDIGKSTLDIIFTNDGYTKVNGKIGSGGFDGLYIKRNDKGDIIDVIINESKGFNGTINLNPKARKNLPQMDQAWINQVIEDLIAFEGDDFEKLDFLDVQNNFLTKVITAVDKRSGEIIVLNNGIHKKLQ